jgi:hypothetical protein
MIAALCQSGLGEADREHQGGSGQRACFHDIVPWANCEKNQ